MKRGEDETREGKTKGVHFCMPGRKDSSGEKEGASQVEIRCKYPKEGDKRRSVGIHKKDEPPTKEVRDREGGGERFLCRAVKQLSTDCKCKTKSPIPREEWPNVETRSRPREGRGCGTSRNPRLTALWFEGGKKKKNNTSL